MTDVRELDALTRSPHPAIEPFTDAFTWPALNARLLARRAPLRSLLVDPSFVARVGPLHADEILWSAGLRYDRRSDTLSAQEVRRLYRAIREVIGDSGQPAVPSDDPDEQAGPEGALGVHGRAGQPCRRCRTPVVHTLLGDDDGGSYYCPKCQS
jgi:formamidopyrimidine-DNA glycosylase